MTDTTNAPVITPAQMLEQWQGHRRLSRKTIEAFPEDKLFSHTIGGMRPFAEMAMEMINIAIPGIEGLVTGKWESFGTETPPKTKKELLALWDETTEHINKLWPLLATERLQVVEKAFNVFDGPNYWTLLYFIDNEIHHRGQGYVYLRSLGIEPPHFWER